MSVAAVSVSLRIPPVPKMGDESIAEFRPTLTSLTASVTQSMAWPLMLQIAVKCH